MLALLIRLELSLLARLESRLDHFDLAQGAVYLCLRGFYVLKSVLMSFSELDKPVSDLFQETVCIPKLLIKSIVAQFAIFGFSILCRICALRLDLVWKLEFAAKSVDKLLHLADIAADLVNDLGLLFNSLLGDLEHRVVLLTQLLGVLLFVINLLHLHRQSLDFKLHLFVESGLLLDLAVFPFLNCLMRTDLVVQVFDPSEQV